MTLVRLDQPLNFILSRSITERINTLFGEGSVVKKVMGGTVHYSMADPEDVTAHSVVKFGKKKATVSALPNNKFAVKKWAIRKDGNSDEHNDSRSAFKPHHQPPHIFDSESDAHNYAHSWVHLLHTEVNGNAASMIRYSPHNNDKPYVVSHRINQKSVNTEKHAHMGDAMRSARKHVKDFGHVDSTYNYYHGSGNKKPNGDHE